MARRRRSISSLVALVAALARCSSIIGSATQATRGRSMPRRRRSRALKITGPAQPEPATAGRGQGRLSVHRLGPSHVERRLGPGIHRLHGRSRLHGGVTGDRLAQGRSPRLPRSCRALPRARCVARECREAPPGWPGWGSARGARRALRDRGGDERPRATAPAPGALRGREQDLLLHPDVAEEPAAEVRIRRRIGRASREERVEPRVIVGQVAGDGSHHATAVAPPPGATAGLGSAEAGASVMRSVATTIGTTPTTRKTVSAADARPLERVEGAAHQEGEPPRVPVAVLRGRPRAAARRPGRGRAAPSARGRR